jgi:diacylglycerol kinase (ATP)
LKVIIIRNPVAGGRKHGKAWHAAHGAFAAQFSDLEVHDSRSSGDAIRLAREQAERGCDLIVAAGGDGTISDVVHGILTSARPDTPLAFLPIGTGCDFVRNFALPADPAEIARRIAAATPRKIDAGLLLARDRDGREQRRYFANITSVGISGEIVEAVNAPGRRKILSGPLRFLVFSVLAILRYRPYAFDILVDGMRVHEGRLAVAAIANGAWFGGGMHIAPHADLTDGLFDIAVMREETVIGLLGLLKSLYSAGHIGHPLLSFHRGRRIELRPQEPARFPVEVDGEAPVRGGFVAEIVPGALTIRV